VTGGSLEVDVVVDFTHGYSLNHARGQPRKLPPQLHGNDATIVSGHSASPPFAVLILGPVLLDGSEESLWSVLPDLPAFVLDVQELSIPQSVMLIQMHRSLGGLTSLLENGIRLLTKVEVVLSDRTLSRRQPSRIVVTGVRPPSLQRDPTNTWENVSVEMLPHREIVGSLEDDQVDRTGRERLVIVVLDS